MRNSAKMSGPSGWKIFSPGCKITGWVICLGSLLLMAASPEKTLKMEWKNCPPIPPRPGMEVQFGLAGPVAGADGKRVMVAGGANFEDGMPWRGGTKKYHDDIYLLEEISEGKFKWTISGQKLPQPMAYPACVTTKEGFISLGGENDHGPLKSVWWFRFSNGVVEFVSLPDLPSGLSSPCAALIDNQIFVAGGLDQKGATTGFYALRLDKTDAGWETLPDIPVRLSHAVMVAQQDGSETALYVLGGRCRNGEVTSFFSTVSKYSPSSRKWQKDSDIHAGEDLRALSAGTGFALGDHQIVLTGGDRGILFNRTEKMNNQIDAEKNLVKKDELLKEKDQFLTSHTGFSGDILIYNTKTHDWTRAGTIPGAPPVTTVCFRWKNRVMIPSGEIRPGVRTDKVLMLEVD